LRVLLVHNFYGSAAPSGENEAYEAEKSLLLQEGHEVAEFTRTSDGIRAKKFFGPAQGALSTPWNPWSFSAIRRQVENFAPSIVHVHNTFPLISPSVFWAIGTRAATVVTLHNYRIFCPAAIPLRKGEVCTECLDTHSAWPSVRYGCYRASRIATAPLAISVELHRRIGTWRTRLDAIIALSDFQRTRMIAGGLPKNRLYVKPNFYPRSPAPTQWSERGDFALFAGRLSVEKGVEALVRAWLQWGRQAPELRVLGDGPLRARLEAEVLAASNSRIRFYGQVSPVEAQAHIATARLVLIPSICFEGFPMVVPAAFAFGTPIAASNIGPLPSIIHEGQNGLLFTPGDPLSILAKVRMAWSEAPTLERLSGGARRSFDEAYSAPANYIALMAIYESAIANSMARSNTG
jgi:glycosyltransferase involved in cell wall biosynthesis